MNKNISDVFNNIYSNNKFNLNIDPDESKSGPGSNYSFMKPYIPELEKFLAEFNIKTWLDVGCGDWAWAQHVNYDGHYIGSDISDLILNETKNKYQSNNSVKCGSTREFVVLDATSDDLPKADFVLCKDVMIHLPLELCIRLINNVKKSKSKYLGITQYSDTKNNVDIPAGNWAGRNYLIQPFNFNQPAYKIEMPELGCDKKWYHKSISIWEM